VFAGRRGKVIPQVENVLAFNFTMNDFEEFFKAIDECSEKGYNEWRVGLETLMMLKF